MSAPTPPPSPEPPASFWKRFEVRLALVVGFFTVMAALVNSTSTLLKKSDPPANPPAGATSSSSQSSPKSSSAVTVNSSTPVTVNTNISLAPAVTASQAETKSPVLEQFTLNTSESFFQLCTKGSTCTWGQWPRGVVHWEPSDLYWRFSGTDYIRSAADDKKYNQDRSFYDRHFQPVFDIVISNPLARPIVLTAIDAITLKQTEYAAGDGEDSADAGIIKVAHRYVVPVGAGSSGDSAKFPILESAPATPPLEISPSHPGRFQVSLENRFGNLEIYEMRLRFHFGSNGTVQTSRFRVTF